MSARLCPLQPPPSLRFSSVHSSIHSCSSISYSRTRLCLSSTPISRSCFPGVINFALTVITKNSILREEDPEIVGYLHQWKGKSAKELEEKDDFFDALISVHVEKVIRLVVIKEIKGAQYGVQIETAVRDRLAADDKYEDEEEAALEKVVEFFQSKYFKKHSVITYHFPANSLTAAIMVSLEGKEDSKFDVENANVVETIKKWYLGGSRAVSPSTISSLASTLSAELSK